MMKLIFPSYETSSSSSSSLLPTSAVSTLFHNNVTFPPKSPSAPVVTAPASYSSASSSSASSVLGKRSNDVEQVAIKRTSSSFSSSTTSPSSIVPVEDTTELLFGNEPDYPRMIFKIQRSQTVDYVMNHYCVNAKVRKEDISFSYKGELLDMKSTFRDYDNHESITVVKVSKR
jgi:hypothetical protein